MKKPVPQDQGSGFFAQLRSVATFLDEGDGCIRTSKVDYSGQTRMLSELHEFADVQVVVAVWIGQNSFVYFTKQFEGFLDRVPMPFCKSKNSECLLVEVSFGFVETRSNTEKGWFRQESRVNHGNGRVEAGGGGSREWAHFASK